MTSIHRRSFVSVKGLPFQSLSSMWDVLYKLGRDVCTDKFGVELKNELRLYFLIHQDIIHPFSMMSGDIKTSTKYAHA